MTIVDIINLHPPRHPHAIFVSAGDRETFATYALERLSENFDVLIFSYGKDSGKHSEFQKRATMFAKGTGSKFNALKALYDQNPQIIRRYKTVWLCDDDLVPETGDLRSLPAAAELYGVKVLSPAHSRKGKISKIVMLPRIGSHYLRYTSYVENTCPLFRTDALEKFLGVFDGSLTAYGDDWWYLQVLGVDLEGNKGAGVVDAVTIINPHDRAKPGGFGELEQVERVAVQRERWHRRRKELGLKDEWTPRSRGTLSIEPDRLKNGAYHAQWFERPWASQWKIFLADLNYTLRFYKLRKRILSAMGRAAA